MLTDLRSAGFSALRIGGELARRANLNFDRLEREDYQPPHLFRGNDGWPGDLEGRAVLAWVLLAQATGRPPSFLDETLRLFPSRMNARGYLGEIHPEGVVSEQQLAGHGWVLRALCEHYQWTGAETTLAMIRRIVENLALPTRGMHKGYPIDPAQRKHEGEHAGAIVDRQGGWMLSSDTGCDFIFLDGIVHAYEILKTRELAELADEMIARYLQMDIVAIRAQTHASLTGMRALLRYAGLIGREDLVWAVEERYRKYRALAMTENYANWNWFGRPFWTEPCAFIDAFIVAVGLWRFTRQAAYLEDAHHIYYNAFGHGQRQNGGFGCDTCAGVDSKWGAEVAKGVDFSPFIGVSMPEAPWCCTMRGGEGLARAAEYAFFAGAKAFALPFFFEGEATVRLGERAIQLREKTGYPLGGNVRLEIVDGASDGPVEVRFFAPAWTRAHRVLRNGQRANVRASDGFLSLTVALKPRDVIDFAFEQNVGVAPAMNSMTPGGCRTVRWGPLILGCDAREEVRLGADAELVPAGEGRVQVRGRELVLAPINDMLDREASKEHYRRQILFR